MWVIWTSWNLRTSHSFGLSLSSSSYSFGVLLSSISITLINVLVTCLCFRYLLWRTSSGGAMCSVFVRIGMLQGPILYLFCVTCLGSLCPSFFVVAGETTLDLDLGGTDLYTGLGWHPWPCRQGGWYASGSLPSLPIIIVCRLALWRRTVHFYVPIPFSFFLDAVIFLFLSCASICW